MFELLLRISTVNVPTSLKTVGMESLTDIATVTKKDGESVTKTV